MENGNIRITILVKRLGFFALALLLFLLAVNFLSSCGKKEQGGQISLAKGTTTQSQQQTAQLMADLLSQQDTIRQAPGDISLREKLVAISVDKSRNVVRAAGLGKPAENAASSAVARQSAELASYLDACRWAAYIIEWSKHTDSPNFGSISGNIPGARVLDKNISADGQVLTLVETNLP